MEKIHICGQQYYCHTLAYPHPGNITAVYRFLCEPHTAAYNGSIFMRWKPHTIY